MAQDRDDLLVGMEQGSAVAPGQLTYFDDINAVRMFLFGSELLPEDMILQRQKGTFVRGSYLVQSLGQALVPKSGYHVEIDHNMLVEFYASSYVEAMKVAGDLMMLLGAGYGAAGQLDPTRRHGGLVLPYWNMSLPTPEIFTDEWWAENRGFEPGSVPILGPRVVQDTVVINCEQEDSEVLDIQDWTVSCTFRMLAPRVIYDVNQERLVTEVKLTGVYSG